MEEKKKKLNLKIIIPVVVAIVVIAVIIILAKNTRTIVINTPNSNNYTISGAIIEFHDIEQSYVSYLRELEILTKSESTRTSVDKSDLKGSYSFEELIQLFNADYEKICKVYDKAYKQIEDNVKVAIPMKNYKKSLDIINEGIVKGELYEGCNNEKYLKAIGESRTTGTDFIMNFSDNYRK